MTKRLTTVLLASWLPFACAQAAVAPACPPAIVGVSDLGYSSYLDGGTVRGSNVDVLQAIEKRSGCPLTVRWFPRSRLYAEFFNQRLDMTGASFRSAERDRYGTWLPYTYTRFELVLLNKHAGKFHSLAEFVERSTARLNITRGIFYTPETQVQLDRLQKLGRLEYVNDYGVVFRKIQAGRAEGTLAPPTIHVLYQRQFNMVGQMASMPVAESPRALIGLYVSSRLPPDVVRRYADGLRTMVSDGSVEKFYVSYLGEEIGRHIFSAGVRDILDAMPRL